MNTGLKATFYGDDVTGASDNAAQFYRHGLRTILFIGTPSASSCALALQDHPDIIGIAGVARALPTDEMEAELLPALSLLHGLGAPLLQYKCCSTLDSSPQIGSLGEACRLLRCVRPGAFLSVLAAMPEFGRYTVFGQHFARFGEEIFMLDRHPSMLHHPVTPSYEADIRQLFTSQGEPITRLVNVQALEHLPLPMLVADLEKTDAAVFDTLTELHLQQAAGTIWTLAQRRHMAAVAAQGLAHGLGLYLRATGMIKRPPPTNRLAEIDRLLVLSGSRSPRSAAQIDWAAQAGFATMQVSEAVMRAGSAGVEALRDGIEHLRKGRSLVIYSAHGMDETSLAPSHATAGALSTRLGALYAAFARMAAKEAGVRRIVLAGGDSASFTMRALGSTAIEIQASHFRQNAHIGRIRSTDPLLDGMEILLKGGQVGDDNLYGVIRDGFDDATI